MWSRGGGAELDPACLREQRHLHLSNSSPALGFIETSRGAQGRAEPKSRAWLFSKLRRWNLCAWCAQHLEESKHFTAPRPGGRCQLHGSGSFSHTSGSLLSGRTILVGQILSLACKTSLHACLHSVSPDVASQSTNYCRCPKQAVFTTWASVSL